MDSWISFDTATHTYTRRGGRVVSVTQALHRVSTAMYAMVEPEIMARAAALGKAVHRMIELEIAGDLDEDSLRPEWIPYLEAWREFKNRSGFNPLLYEARVYSEKYNFAGTLDLFGTMHGDAVLIDTKRTATVPLTAGPQTAGYEIALRETFPDIVAMAASGSPAGHIDRYALQLQPGGVWSLVPLRDPADRRVFLAALTLNQFEASHGLQC